MLRGLVQVVDPASLTAVVNTGDDTVLHGLHVSPDVDTVLYTLAGVADEDRGWGLAGETWAVMEALERLGGETWFRLGDRDLATHLFRTQRLAEGATLSEVTAELATRLGVAVRVLPMSDDPVRTRLVLADDDRTAGAGPAEANPTAEVVGDEAASGPSRPRRELAFQEYFVRERHAVAVQAVRFDGAQSAAPAPGVLEAITTADTVVVCPSNPVLSIGPILAVAGVRQALEERRTSVIAVSPIVAGTAIKGPADRLLAELGHEPSVVGVARLYARFTATLVIDDADRHLAPAVEAEGVRCIVAPAVMSGPAQAAELARRVLAAAGTGVEPGTARRPGGQRNDPAGREGAVVPAHSPHRQPRTVHGQDGS